MFDPSSFADPTPLAHADASRDVFPRMEGIKTDETKVQAIVEMKPPRNSKEVSEFLGMSQWYAKFIKNYSDICEPLYNLKRKLKKFIWSIQAQKAFDAVKAAVTKAPVLKFPDFKKTFELFTDASSIGVGAVLNQEQRPVVFASRTPSAAERNYTDKCEDTFPPKSLRNEIMNEFHDKPLAGHFGHFKTYHKIRDVCYFPYMRKFIDQYVSTCHMCQVNNYKNALPAGRLIPIVSNYSNEIVTIDLLGPYPMSRVRRNRYVLVITDHFSKWAEIIPLKKASARITADNFFDKYISRFGAPIKLIRDNGLQFISDIFEKLSERLGIRCVKTVVYRPQANRTERVNRDLVQMIANYVNEQHDTWDQFLREFAYAIRTAVNETTGKTPAELFLGRKLITPFQKLVMVSNGTEFAVGDIERLFEEARRNTKTKHENGRNIIIYAGVMCKLRYKRSHESRSGGPERKVQKGSEHRVNKRALSSNYRTNHSLTKFRKKSRREETVAPTISGYNLRPRKGKRKWSPDQSIERKTQQGGPV
ncbi:retrovirus-related Pol polyprotein from transposon 297 [Trichonephila clavipes]|nr:retrovirus-related Pol polyprotein from transposon 297 [Trichonephila clavipes]